MVAGHHFFISLHCEFFIKNSGRYTIYGRGFHPYLAANLRTYKGANNLPTNAGANLPLYIAAQGLPRYMVAEYFPSYIYMCQMFAFYIEIITIRLANQKIRESSDSL